MAVARVLAEADVADDQQFRVGVLQTADRLLDDAVAGLGAAAALVLVRREPEEQHGRDLEGPQATAPPRPSASSPRRSWPGIAAIGLPPAEAGIDEQRVDKVTGA